MNTTEKVYTLLNQRGGHLTSREARENGIEGKILQRMAERGLVERAVHGLYVGADIFPDPFLVAQHRCPKGIFSHETALFLHGLSDRDPLRLTMTIPSGWNTLMLTDENMQFYYNRPRLMVLGICDVATPSGVKVRAFDVERTLCDCMRNIDKLDRDLVLTAIKRYAKGTERDSAKLLEYASELKIRDVVYRYMEVLS